MKSLFKSGWRFLLASLLLSGCGVNKQASTGGEATRSLSQNTVTYQNFYDDLAPYGTWIDYASYGHVWHPAVDGEFRPYLSNGYWNYSNEGWMWQSNYNWGWAPFHYGRWVYDNAYGWLWIPGYEWSPAWVTWGTAGNFYAWAPLMPEVNVGIGFGAWRPGAFYWNVCGREHLYDRDIFNRVETREVVTRNLNSINVINEFSTTSVHRQFYAKGPDVKEVEHYTGHAITPQVIKEVNNASLTRHEGNVLQVYRPAVTHPQPREFRRIDNNVLPVHNNEEKIPLERNKQNENIQRLPIHRAPENTLMRSPEFFRRANGGMHGRMR